MEVDDWYDEHFYVPEDRRDLIGVPIGHTRCWGLRFSIPNKSVPDDVLAARRKCNSGYKSRRLRHTPKWLNRKLLRPIYSSARWQTISTGIKHCVDHIVPLKHPYVCGLHVPWNLRVITSKANSRKRDSFNEIQGVHKTPLTAHLFSA